MADSILKAVAIRRDLIEGADTAVGLNALINRYASAALYDGSPRSDRAIARLETAIARAMAKEYLPQARAIGRKAAEPVLKAEGLTIAELRGGIRQQDERYAKSNLASFYASLKRETGGLSNDINVAFVEALRDGRSRKELVEALVSADRSELISIRQGRLQQQKASRVLRRAEERASRTGNYDVVDAAREKLNRIKGNVKARKSFLARFETRVQAQARDHIRRQAEHSQTMAFRQGGYDTFTWIAVNASGACPSCQARHGKQVKAEEYASESPGNAETYCGSACMCVLVPEGTAADQSRPNSPLHVEETAAIDDVPEVRGRPVEGRMPGPAPEVIRKVTGWKPFESVEEARRIVINEGVERAEFGGDLAIANNVAQALAEAKARGIQMPRSVEVAPAEFSVRSTSPAKTRDGRILINTDAPFWKDPQSYAKRRYIVGDWSTEDSLHVILHETAHAHQQLDDPEAYKRLKKLADFASIGEIHIAGQVSGYASLNPAEFIAELFVGRAAGVRYNTSVMDLARKYGPRKLRR
ncbi:MAG: hypothetical protein ABFD92_16795 [Planctomycetaceae bacterium]|nr:hypothetical protein [Planctomycetaceae bacterium]